MVCMFAIAFWFVIVPHSPLPHNVLREFLQVTTRDIPPLWVAQLTNCIIFVLYFKCSQILAKGIFSKKFDSASTSFLSPSKSSAIRS